MLDLASPYTIKHYHCTLN